MRKKIVSSMSVRPQGCAKYVEVSKIEFKQRLDLFQKKLHNACT